MSLRSCLVSGVHVIFASSQSCLLLPALPHPNSSHSPKQQPCYISEGTTWLWCSLSFSSFLFLAKPTAGKGFPGSCCACSPPPLAADQPHHSGLVLLVIPAGCSSFSSLEKSPALQKLKLWVMGFITSAQNLEFCCVTLISSLFLIL